MKTLELNFTLKTYAFDLGELSSELRDIDVPSELSQHEIDHIVDMAYRKWVEETVERNNYYAEVLEYGQNIGGWELLQITEKQN